MPGGFRHPTSLLYAAICLIGAEVAWQFSLITLSNVILAVAGWFPLVDLYQSFFLFGAVD